MWTAERNAAGKLSVNITKFPSGLTSLGSRLRKIGIGMGLYTDLSNRNVGKVCGTGPGSFGHYAEDAATIVGYGATFVKVDYCAYDWNGPQYA